VPWARAKSRTNSWSSRERSPGTATRGLLNGGASDRAKRTKDAAIALRRAKQRLAIGALVKEDTRVDWHRLDSHEAAVRTGES
jgi:hypothetical protein